MNNYARGRGKEYRVMAKLIKEGYEVFRSAGSHSFTDLVAIKTIPTNVIRFVQCKPREFSARAKEKLIQENKKYNGLFNVSYEVWT